MVGLFLILIAALLFAQAWYFLGLYSDARTFGLLTAALAFGIAATVGGTFDPVILNEEAALLIIGFRAFVILWAVYGAAVAAHGLWGFEERATASTPSSSGAYPWPSSPCPGSSTPI